MRLQGGDQEQVRRALPVLLRLFGSVLTNPHRIPLPPGLNCSYRFSHLMYIRQALAHSTKTSLRTDENGILSMQFMIASAQAARGLRLSSLRACRRTTKMRKMTASEGCLNERGESACRNRKRPASESTRSNVRG